MIKKEKIKKKELPEVPEVSSGYERQWYKCPDCGKLQYYDYVPYSLSNPILTSVCGHTNGRKLHEYMIEIQVV